MVEKKFNFYNMFNIFYKNLNKSEFFINNYIFINIEKPIYLRPVFTYFIKNNFINFKNYISLKKDIADLRLLKKILSNKKIKNFAFLNFKKVFKYNFNKNFINNFKLKFYENILIINLLSF